MQLLEQMAQQNPMFNQVMQMCRGKTPQEQEQIFFTVAQQMGYDGRQILELLK